MEPGKENARRVLEELTHPQEVCTKCKLHGEGCLSPQMAGTGKWFKPRLAIVGDSPSYPADEEDVPMTGATLRLIKRTVEGAGLSWGEVWLTNSVRCHATSGKTPDRGIKNCRELLFRELDAVQPEIVLALGAPAMFSLTEQKGIMQLHGNVTEVQIGGKATPVVTAFHPSMIVRDPARIDDFCDDVEKAVGLLRTGGKVIKTPVDYRIVRTEDDLKTIAHEINAREVLSWDIETTGTRAHSDGAEVVCVSLSTAPNSGWLLLLNHRDANTICSVPMERRIEWLKWALEKSPAKLYGQNLKFDMGYVRVCLGIEPRTPAMDVYIAHHLLDEEASKNGGNALKVMARRYTDMGDYEQPAIRKAGGEKQFYSQMATAPVVPGPEAGFEETLTYYACSDTDAVLRIAEVLRPRLEAENLLSTLSLELHKTMMLTDLEVQGAGIDWEYHATLLPALPAQLDALLADLRKFPQVKLAEHYTNQKRKKPKPEDEMEPFNVDSPTQVALLIFDVLGLPPVGRKTKAGKDSTGKENVTEWLEGLDSSSDAAKILKLITRYKQLSKMNSSYIQPLVNFRGNDGRIHPRYNQGLTATWRLSSQEPNAQQLPKKDGSVANDNPDAMGRGAVKRMYVGAEPGWWVAEADYSQIELRVAGVISQDDGFIETYNRGEDLHTRTAAGLFGVELRDVTPEMRAVGKTINFGILYGMGAPALSKRLRVPIKVAEQRIAGFWNTYPAFNRWVKDTTRFMREHQYAESMFGHRRHLPNVTSPNPEIAARAERQGINFPIQCTASNLTMYAEMFINDIFKEEEMRSRCFGQVHDSIWVTGPPEEKETALTIVKVVMENPGFPMFNGGDPRWPRSIPLIAEVNVGMNLRDLELWEPAR